MIWMPLLKEISLIEHDKCVCLMALIKGPPNFVGSLVEWWVKPCPLVLGCLWRRCNCSTLIASGCWVDLRIMKPKMCTVGFRQMFCIPWLFRVVFWLVLGGTPSFPWFFFWHVCLEICHLHSTSLRSFMLWFNKGHYIIHIVTLFVSNIIKLKCTCMPNVEWFVPW